MRGHQASSQQPGYPAADPADGEQTQRLAADMLREAAGLDLTFVRAPASPVAGLLRIAGEVHADSSWSADLWCRPRSAWPPGAGNL